VKGTGDSYNVLRHVPRLVVHFIAVKGVVEMSTANLVLGALVLSHMVYSEIALVRLAFRICKLNSALVEGSPGLHRSYQGQSGYKHELELLGFGVLAAYLPSVTTILASVLPSVSSCPVDVLG